MNLLDLTGRVGLITGATGDIGAAVVQVFAEHGADVAIQYLERRDRAEQLAAYARHQGRRAFTIQANLLRISEIEAMVARIAADLGRIDILVNSAGARRKPGQPRHILDVTEADWDLELDTHLKAAFLCSQSCVPHMISGHFGRIINVSSVMARSGARASVHYPSAKMGILGFTRALAHQVAADGVTVNAVAPGFIDSERIHWRDPDELKAQVAMIPVQRLGKPEEVATAILFLASSAAAYITGATLDINGGLYMA
ncbi:MAG: 3-oxoacyl-ACP reductase family protein [Bryobacteraceae bacterium]